MSGPYDANAARQDYINQMVSEGFLISYPADRELQIDIDTEEQYQVYLRSLEVARNNIPSTWDWEIRPVETPSRSGLPARHIRIRMPFPLTPASRIAWQAAFGSDPLREMLSLLRLEKGDVHPTLLVELPETSEEL